MIAFLLVICLLSFEIINHWLSVWSYAQIKINYNFQQ